MFLLWKKKKKKRSPSWCSAVRGKMYDLRWQIFDDYASEYLTVPKHPQEVEDVDELNLA